jgi:streptomycin 6-kinase
VPEKLAAHCAGHFGREAWLKGLSSLVERLSAQWQIEIAAPIDTGAGWVAPALRADGSACFFKAIMPHFEADHEIDGLLHWAGNAAVQVWESDRPGQAYLMQACTPGRTLADLPPHEQDSVIASLLRRLWAMPLIGDHRFRTLASMLELWSAETLAGKSRWHDAGLVREGLHLFLQLPQTAPCEVLLLTDLHADNVLSSHPEPWTVIDPKPFVGDPAYDATQHLLSLRERLQRDPSSVLQRFADLLELDHERVRLWLFARLAAGPQFLWSPEDAALARRILS